MLLRGMVCGVVGVSKERKTFSLDPGLVEELDERNKNASGVVNDLLEEYLVGGTDAAVGKELRIKDIEQKMMELQNERDRINRHLERLRNEKRSLEQQIDEARQKEREKLQEASKYVAGKDADNPAVENWADKLNMDVYELKRKVDELEQ